MFISPAIGITARILFTLIFFLSGVGHFAQMQNFIDLMPAAIPFRAFWVISSGLVELAGAVMILFNYRPRLGGWLIVRISWCRSRSSFMAPGCSPSAR